MCDWAGTLAGKDRARRMTAIELGNTQRGDQENGEITSKKCKNAKTMHEIDSDKDPCLQHASGNRKADRPLAPLQWECGPPKTLKFPILYV